MTDFIHSHENCSNYIKLKKSSELLMGTLIVKGYSDFPGQDNGIQKTLPDFFNLMLQPYSHETQYHTTFTV